MFDVFGMVARVVSQSEINRTPEAQKAMDAVWEKLRKNTCWLEHKVREYDDVANEARKNNAKVHFGRILEEDGGPNKKWKGRSVSKETVRVTNIMITPFSLSYNHPRPQLESGKILGAYGSQPGFSQQQADARQADTQALSEGITGYVCPLRLALYGHPMPEVFGRNIARHSLSL